MSNPDNITLLGCPLGDGCPCCGGDDDEAVEYEHRQGEMRVACACGVAGPWGDSFHEAATGWNELPRTTADEDDYRLYVMLRRVEVLEDHLIAGGMSDDELQDLYVDNEVPAGGNDEAREYLASLGFPTSDPDWGTFTPQDLMESGLLFAINRQVMHPLGLALSVIADKETGRVYGFGPIQDSRDDPEGIIFDADGFADGMAKLERYMGERGTRARVHRLHALGFVDQGPGDVERLDATDSGEDSDIEEITTGSHPRMGEKYPRFGE